MLVGKQTWIFQQQPSIISTSTVGGPFEANGKLTNHYDYLFDDLMMGQQTFEKAHEHLMETSAELTIEKANLKKKDISFFISGDLINQLTPTNYTADTLGIPYFGLFSACATMTESLSLAALMVNTGAANYVLCGSSSHNAAAERQYRYPTEYGGQKPPTAQWTVTGAGSAIVGPKTTGPVITSATIGKVKDLGITDPFNMGAAMAPAAVDTIIAHFHDRNIDHTYYDIIATGDLGQVGHNASKEIFKQMNIAMPKDKYVDCGMLIYEKDQPVNAGASGSACSAVVTYGYLLNKLRQKKIKRLLIVATGALHSPLSVQQNGTIPCIAHAVSIENVE